MYPQIENPQRYSVALYLRLSKEDSNKEGGRYFSDDSESIKNQQTMLEKYAKEQNLSVYHIYIDDGFSGTNIDRPNFQQMLEDIEAQKVNMVITKDLSRFSRDYSATGKFLDEYFPEKNVRYIALLDNIDTGDITTGNEMSPFKAVVNDFLARNVSKTVKATKHSKQDQGLFIGSKAPYGYKKSSCNVNVLEIDELSAKVVRYMFTLALEGKSCREIAMTLNEKNIPTPAQYANLKPPKHQGPHSGKWSSERVTWTLKNEVYIGSMVQSKSQKVSYKSKKCRHIPREEWKVVENTHPAIIDRTTFEKVNMLIKSRSKTRSRTYDYLLKGMIHCHECQHPLAIINRPLADGTDSLYFICRTYQRFTKYETCTCHNIKVDTVTNAVTEQVRNICKQYLDFLDFNELANEAQKMYLNEKKRQEKDITILEHQLATVITKIDKTYDDKLSGLIDEDIFKRAYAKLKEEKKILEQKIASLKRSELNNNIFDSMTIKKLAEQFLNAKECSRELLINLIDRVELTNNKEVIIFFKFQELGVLNNL